MKPRSIYLTIDDSPSKNTVKILQYLNDNQLPAIFFCRGEFIEKKLESVRLIIKYGYLVGNHSYTHPYFSTITTEQCIEEIEKTEQLIEQCYKDANIKRPTKIIRLPFADRGAGKGARSASTEQERSKVDKIQRFLKANNFKSIFESADDFIDAFWDWDTQDYKSKYIASPKDYLRNLEQQWAMIEHKCPVMLIHDFDHNYELFKASMSFLKNNKITCQKFPVR